MNELLSTDLWSRLRQLASTASRKHAAIAYVTDDRFVKFRQGDVLVTDASDEAIKSGQTSASVLKAALKRGAQIASFPGLHSKLYVFDRHAIIGSANLSRQSERRTEAALLTDHPATVSASRLLIEELKEEGEAVDEAFVARISMLRVTNRRPVAAGRRLKREDDGRIRTWLVGLMPAREKEDEQSFVEEGLADAEQHVHYEDSEVSWMRIRGDSRFRREAKKGDVVVCIWTGSGNKTPNAVYHHAPILLAKPHPSSGATWFYVEEYADAEETTVTWKQFKQLYAQIGMRGAPSQWAKREIPRPQADALHELWFDQA